MTAQEIVLHLLKLIGIDSLDPSDNDSALETGMTVGGTGRLGDVKFAITCLNQAFQYIFREGPGSISERAAGGVLRAPAQLSLSLTQYSSIATTAAATDDMAGRTLKIGNLDYRVIDVDSGVSLTLHRGWEQPDGSREAVIYGDAIELDAAARAVIGPVTIPSRRELIAASGQEQFNSFNLGYGVNHGLPQDILIETQSVHEPVAYIVDGLLVGRVWRKFLRVNPLPDKAYPVDFKLKLNPPGYSLTDIIASGDEQSGPFTDPASVIPGEWIETILLPIACDYMMAHPAFNNSVAERRITRQVQIAHAQLEDMHPHRAPVHAVFTGQIPDVSTGNPHGVFGL